MKFAYIAIFGLIGVFARYGVNVLTSRLTHSAFPFATFFINLTGAFAIGVVYVLCVDRTYISNDLRLGIIVGLLGGYTTFSSYCLEGFQLLDGAQYRMAATYFLLSPPLGLAATFAGVVLTRSLLKG